MKICPKSNVHECSILFIGLQAELEAAYKELNCVKSKLKLQEAELTALRYKHSDKEDDYNLKYSNLNAFQLNLVKHFLLIFPAFFSRRQS